MGGLACKIPYFNIMCQQHFKVSYSTPDRK